jgi:hypothetical protein
MFMVSIVLVNIFIYVNDIIAYTDSRRKIMLQGSELQRGRTGKRLVECGPLRRGASLYVLGSSVGNVDLAVLGSHAGFGPLVSSRWFSLIVNTRLYLARTLVAFFTKTSVTASNNVCWLQPGRLGRWRRERFIIWRFCFDLDRCNTA